MEVLDDVVTWASSGAIWGTIVLTLAAAPLLNFKYAQNFGVEAVGTVVMIALTFAPGKWWGVAGSVLGPELHHALASLHAVVPLDYVLHWVGVVVADYSCGGPHVNPGVATAMLSLGKIEYAQYVVHVAAQMLGGVVGFPLLQALAASLGWTPLGGPALDAGTSLRASAADEFAAMFLLLVTIFALNWESPKAFRDSYFFYPIKQSLTAFAIRGLIVNFGAAGPAINPMLGTTWAVYATGAFPTAFAHYLVYWGASVAGALAASFLYCFYNPEATFFGASLRGKLQPAASKTKKRQ